MRNLILISLFATLILSSCSILKEKPIYKDGPGMVPDVVDTLVDTQIFELQMNYKENEFTGLLLLKKLGDEHYRFVLTSHFGLTVFDLEVDKRDYKVHYCLEPLNRKRALYLLRNDFSILLNPVFFNNIKHKIEDNRLIALERSGSITKTVMSFAAYKGTWPESIKIGHPYLKLYITLTKLPDAIAEPV